MESLGSLAVRLCALPLAAQRLSLASPLALEAACVRVVSEFHARQELGRLSPIADRPGLPGALLRTFAELGQAAVEPQAVPGELGELYRHYRSTLVRLSLTDRAGLFRLAIELAQSSSFPPLALPLCVFDVSPETQLERAFLAALLQRAPEAFSTAPPKELGRFEATVLPTSPPALTRLQANLFSTQEANANPSSEADDSVAILSAPGESREAVEIARCILAEADRGVPFDRIAI